MERVQEISFSLPRGDGLSRHIGKAALPSLQRCILLVYSLSNTANSCPPGLLAWAFFQTS